MDAEELNIEERILMTRAVFRSFKVPKILQDFPLYRIFGYMHRALNIDKKTNYTVWL
jgi:hypothetical protein